MFAISGVLPDLWLLIERAGRLDLLAALSYPAALVPSTGCDREGLIPSFSSSKSISSIRAGGYWESSSILQKVSENNGVVLLFVSRGVYQGHIFRSSLFQQGLPGFFIPLQLLLIPPLKLLPSSWVVAVPSPQLIGWSDVFDPAVELQSFSLAPRCFMWVG